MIGSTQTVEIDGVKYEVTVNRRVHSTFKVGDTIRHNENKSTIITLGRNGFYNHVFLGGSFFDYSLPGSDTYSFENFTTEAYTKVRVTEIDESNE